MENYGALFAKVLTRSDLIQLENEIDTMSTNIYKDNSVVESQVRDWVRNFFDQMLANNQEEKQKLLEKIKLEMSKFETVELTLAYEPTRKNLVDIHAALTGIFNYHFLLDVKYDPALIAGCQIISRGEFKDLSLGRTITREIDNLIASQYIHV